MLDIASISAVVAAFGMIVGVVFAVLEIRNLARQREIEVETRQAQLFMQILLQRCRSACQKKTDRFRFSERPDGY